MLEPAWIGKIEPVSRPTIRVALNTGRDSNKRLVELRASSRESSKRPLRKTCSPGIQVDYAELASAQVWIGLLAAGQALRSAGPLTWRWQHGAIARLPSARVSF
jgi:hypothetical protein